MPLVPDGPMTTLATDPLAALVTAAMLPLGTTLEEESAEGNRRLFAFAGSDGPGFTVWLEPRRDDSPAFERGEGFLLGYRGEPGSAGYAALRALAERLRELERSGADADWWPAAGGDDGEPALVYSGTRLELRVTMACNERCLFCNSVGATENLARDREDAFAILRRAREQGVEFLVLSGGEPLLVPWLPEVGREARALGYRRVFVQSNAVLLADPGGMARLLATAPDEVILSLHGPDDEVLSAITGVKGLFDRKVEGIVNCLATSIGVVVNVVVCRQNEAHLEAVVDLVAGLPGAPLLLAFSFVAPSGAAARLGKETIPSMTETAPRLLAALRRARAKGLATVLSEYCGIPTCLDPALREFAEPFDLDRPMALPPDRVKPDFCEGCSWNRRCTGILRGYIELYGDKEFRDVPAHHR
jgi:MoaA/NifB/PqqE/SkfB family radical SAM enzyme